MPRGSVTMSDIARQAGVSKMTVSNVVNNRGRVSDAVRDRIMEIIRASGYRMNVSARTLARGRTGVLGLAVPEIDRPYFGTLAALVIQQARMRGFHVAVEQTGEAAEDELEAIAQSNRLEFDGLILCSVHLAPGDPRLVHGDVPIVMLGELEFGADFDHIVMPNEDGTQAATEHLIDRGCERIAFITGDRREGVNVVTRRYRGYLMALRERGRREEQGLLVRVPEMTSEAGRAAAYRMVESGLDFDGVVALTDTVALGVMRGLADRGRRVPDDVRLIGFDNIPETEFTIPSLSTVAPDHRWMAARAVELIGARIEAPERPAVELVAPFTIVQRESSGPAGSGEGTER